MTLLLSTNWLEKIFSFQDFGVLLPLVMDSVWAALLLGVIAGIMGPMIQARDLAFAVHGSSELSFAGASFALLIGLNVEIGSIAGSILAALIFGILGFRARERNSAIGVVLAFGMGLGVLFLALYPGRAVNKFGSLVGQIVATSSSDLWVLGGIAALLAVVISVTWRPLFFASIDPDVAAAKGVPVRGLGLVFMVALGLAVSMCVQLVGALLVLSLLITPAAAAMRVTARPLFLVLLSVLFAITSAVGGLMLSLSPGLPISPYVTSISFAIYLVCRAIGAYKLRHGWAPRTHHDTHHDESPQLTQPA